MAELNEKKKKKKKKKKKMKSSQLLIRIEETEKREFISLCDELDTSAAREIRHFIRAFLKQHANE